MCSIQVILSSYNLSLGYKKVQLIAILLANLVTILFTILLIIFLILLVITSR
jgi:hypothetical protein